MKMLALIIHIICLLNFCFVYLEIQTKKIIFNRFFCLIFPTVLSQSSSNQSNSQSTTRKRTREEDEPHRNVGKRTGGRPQNRDNSDATSSQSQRQPAAFQPIPMFTVPSNTQPSSSSSEPTNSQLSNESVATNGYLDVTDNDENVPPTSPNQRRHVTTVVSITVPTHNRRSNRSNSSADSSQNSFQTAPVPRNRPVRDFPRPTGG